LSRITGVMKTGRKAMNDMRAVKMRDTSATDVAIDQAPSRQRRKITLVGVVVMGLALAFAVLPRLSSWINSDLTVAAERIRTAAVVRGDFIRDLGVEGRVIAAVSPTLYASASGTVTLKVQPGDNVAVDQVLAILDSPEVEAEYQQEQSSLQRLWAELQRQKIQSRKTQAENRQKLDLAEVTLKAARREMHRADLSFANHSISESDFERYKDELARAQVEFSHAGQDAELAVESLEFEVRTRELEMERQQLLLDNLARRVDELTVRAPVAGIVGAIAVLDKAAVTPEQALMTVVDLTAFEVEIGIPQSYADDLGLGMNAEIRYAGQSFDGVLSALSPQVVENQVVGRVKFSGQPPQGIRQNQRVQARIIIEELRDVLKIRRGPFTDSGGGRLAWVIDDQGQAHRQSIRLGARSISEVEIVEGLSEGQMIIISGTAEFDNADTIRIVE
jgi:HlyD family secretion protein